MTDLIFFFQRRPDMSSDEFREHYLGVHAPLGMELTVGMVHYTVNLTHPRHIDDALLAEPHDAMTSITVDDVEAFFDQARAFATPQDAARMLADHDSFIGRMDAYVVQASGRRPAGTPAAKVVARTVNLVDAALVAVREGIEAVVVNTVTKAVTPDAPPLATVVEAWGASADGVRAVLVALDPHATVLEVSEHVFR